MTEVSALVLAAGLSRRMAPETKLLQPFGGRTVVGMTLAQLDASAITDIVVIVGHEAERVALEVQSACERCRLVRAERYADGMAATLREGLSGVRGDVAGVMICLGDMPLVRSRTIDALVAGFGAAGTRQPIVTPVHAGRRGNPVVWHRAHLAALHALRGDAGGRQLLARLAADVVPVDVTDPGVLIDIDTPQSLEAARLLIAS